MRPIFFLTVLSAFLLSACGKNDFCKPDQTTAPAAEVAQLEAYLTGAGITASRDSRGFFYVIKNEGSGRKPTICSTVSVNYAGKLTNGTEFDANNAISFSLRGLIKGWQQGIPLIAPGGSITLYLPPSLGYGSRASGSIPPNSILIFDIDLLASN